ncbi:hypothetical protein ACFQRC_10085 [Enterovirga sp. GCM10030262]|uniref:hypothetical protein n=1 Tax=Enterovirga sp. GCM10030262 TaxID=3273391 RepID=UPI00360A4AE1
MIFLISSVTAAMIGYMAWRLLFRMRGDRIRTERKLTRGKFAFRPKERLRFLLRRSFDVSPNEPEWEAPLLSSLARIPAGSRPPIPVATGDDDEDAREPRQPTRPSEAVGRAD